MMEVLGTLQPCDGLLEPPLKKRRHGGAPVHAHGAVWVLGRFRDPHAFLDGVDRRSEVPQHGQTPTEIRARTNRWQDWQPKALVRQLAFELFDVASEELCGAAKTAGEKVRLAQAMIGEHLEGKIIKARGDGESPFAGSDRS